VNWHLTRIISSPFQLLAFFHRVIHASQFIHQVVDCTQGMTPWHPWAGKTHYVLRFLPLGGLVTVDRAICTGGFIRTIRTLLQPPLGILHQAGTICTEIGAFVIVMVVITVNAGHADQRFVLVFQSACEFAHVSILVDKLA
jgi:hypothetical protein